MCYNESRRRNDGASCTELFLTVAREENISAAARVLHLAQPALSRQLRNLEEELGKETAEWAGGKVAFKCVYGCGGNVANEYWFGTENGDNILVAPGEYTITLNPAEKTVTVK